MEKISLFDVNARPLGRTVIRNRYQWVEGEYHISAELWIADSQNRFLCQLRSAQKSKFPLMWAESAGGCGGVNEDFLACIIRETHEELGLTVSPSELIDLGRETRTHDLKQTYLLKKDINISELKLQKEEVSQVAWLSYTQIETKIRNRQFVPTVVGGLQLAARKLGIID